MRLLVFVCLGLPAVVCGFGCGQSSSRVQGMATYADKPLVLGTVTLMSEQGYPFQGEIDRDGKFAVTGVPFGTYKVFVQSVDRSKPREDLPAELAEQKKERAKRKSAAGWFPIPEKYTSPEQSGLTLTVDKAIVNFDLNMAP